MSVRLGTNPIAWSNDDLRELGSETPLETCLSEARAAGFTGIELGHKFPSEPDALRAVLGRHDLALVSGWYSTKLLERDAAAVTVTRVDAAGGKAPDGFSGNSFLGVLRGVKDSHR